MVIQLVTATIRPEQRERWLELAVPATSRTRLESGCESVQISEDLESPNSFHLVEVWTDMDAQYDHFRTPEFGELMGALQDVLTGPPEVTIHEVASTQTMEEALGEAGVG